ncbi:MAG: DUF4389 domain-containing protein [Candidatus Marinimicrobia bacterium]|nr:DUF4389 domain-containing protein [Candidatus Neomarinimicrobiota bacterium]
MAENKNMYPVDLSIDYPDRPLNRLTSFFRIFTIIPIGIIALIMMQTLPFLQIGTNYNTNEQEVNYFFTSFSTSGIEVGEIVILTVVAVILVPIIIFTVGFIMNLFNPIVLMLVFRRKYPKWWFDYYVMLIKFITRVGGYFMLLTDVYPSTDEDQNVHIDITYPDAEKNLSQGLPLIKWFLVIPHYIALALLALVVCVCDVLIWFAILFTGRIPRSLFDLIVGFYRWNLRVSAYAYFQFTDKYPPFSLEE